MAAAAAQEPARLKASTFNPFINCTHDMHTVEWIKLLVLLPTLGVLRLLAIIVLVLISFVWCNIAMLGAPARATRPLPAWRRALIRPVLFVPRAILFVLGFYKIRGACDSKKEIRKEKGNREKKKIANMS